MTTTIRVGVDTALKIRLATLSTAAAKTLGYAISRDCSDVRVANALAAALQESHVPEVRAQLTELAHEITERMEPVSDTRTQRITVRVSEDEFDRIAANAEAENSDMSDLLRRRGLERREPGV